jgi:hypothetical protein
MSKMGLHDPFGHFKHKLWSKEGPGVKLANSQSLKVENHPNLPTCRWRATYRWKDLDEGYNFALDLISIGGLHAKVWTPKVAKIPVVGISGLPLGSSRIKCHLGVSYMARHKV